MDFLTIDGSSEAVVREKMSRFLAFAHHTASVEEAKAVIADYQRRYHDARHVCWAYMIGSDRATFLSSDNGEPSGTAGKPILGQINSLGLTDVTIVVVRYFGGIKLGTSGLIAAYREAARLALEGASVVEGHDMTTITFTFPYIAMNDVMRLVKQTGAEIEAQDFDNTCRLTLRLQLNDAPAIESQLSDIDGVCLA